MATSVEYAEKGKLYMVAPLTLHRVCTDLTHSPPACQQYGTFGMGLEGACGVSMLAQRDGHALRAAHDLVRSGRRIPCLVHRQDVSAPDGTAFVCDRVWPQRTAPAMHFSLVPVCNDVALATLQAVVDPTLPTDASVWQPCQLTAGELIYDPPPNPSDRKLRQTVKALEVLALDEGQPDQLRRDARVLQYHLCYEHRDVDDKDWTWVVEHLAPSDKYLTYVIKTALDVAPEPDADDLNVLLWFRLVKLEINDCWDDHQQGSAGPLPSQVRNAEEGSADGCGSIDALLTTTVGVL